MQVRHALADDSRKRIAIEGLETPVTILHMTDSHLFMIDDRDQAAHERFDEGARRQTRRPYQVRFEAFCEYAAELNPDLIAWTGDIISFPSQANLDCAVGARRSLSSPVLFTCGNHDWLFPGDPKTDETRRAFWPALQGLTDGEAECSMREIGGIRFVAIDNSIYQVNDRQLEFFRSQLAGGKPVVLLIHIPLSCPALREPVMRRWGSPIMMGAPEWPSLQSRRNWGAGDEDTPATSEFLKTAAKAPNLVAVLAGHIHFAHRDPISETCVQYVGRPVFDGRQDPPLENLFDPFDIDMPLTDPERHVFEFVPLD